MLIFSQSYDNPTNNIMQYPKTFLATKLLLNPI